MVSKTPFFKITKEKWARGVIQAVEHLFCKLKALSSNPTSTKKKSLLMIKIKNEPNSFHFDGRHDRYLLIFFKLQMFVSK
jgi:hypothetical protein